MFRSAHVVDSEAPVLSSVRHLHTRDVDVADDVAIGDREAVGGDAGVVGQGGAVQLPRHGGSGVAGELAAERDLLTPLNEELLEGIHHLGLGGWKDRTKSARLYRVPGTERSQQGYTGSRAQSAVSKVIQGPGHRAQSARLYRVPGTERSQQGYTGSRAQSQVSKVIQGPGHRTKSARLYRVPGTERSEQGYTGSRAQNEVSKVRATRAKGHMVSLCAALLSVTNIRKFRN